jgi:hypothetical protein
MTTLSDEEIKAIVRRAAAANNVSARDVSLGPITDSTGSEAIQVVISIPAGTTHQLVGSPCSRRRRRHHSDVGRCRRGSVSDH